MKVARYQPLAAFFALTLGSGCSQSFGPTDPASVLMSAEVIDLGAVVTEDLPEQFWGRALMDQMGFDRQNSFEVIQWEFPAEGSVIHGSNAYLTLFNHGGPHVDAPNHVGEKGGIEDYGVDAFFGPVKVFDVHQFPPGRSVPVDVFRGRVQPGDIVLIHTDYSPPQIEEEVPEVRTLTDEAAEYLATLPVRAYGTDSISVESLDKTQLPWVHQVFLARAIPVYEQLLNLDQLLGKTNMFFVGAPLNIKNADGMLVRPLVFIP